MSDKEKKENESKEPRKVVMTNNTDQKQIVELEKEILTFEPRGKLTLEWSYEHYFKQVAHLIKRNVITLK